MPVKHIKYNIHGNNNQGRYFRRHDNFEGEISTRVLYSSEDDRPVLVSLTSRDSFREEIEDPKSTSNSMIEAFARVYAEILKQI